MLIKRTVLSSGLIGKNTLLEVTLSNQSALKSQYFSKQVTKVPLKQQF